MDELEEDGMGIVLIGLDLETSGLEPKADRLIEIGAVVYDWDTKMPMQILSELIDPKMENDEFKLPEEITKITGITEDALGKYGGFERDVLVKLDSMIQFADYFVAHNGNLFDRPFLEEAYRRNQMVLVEKPWVDTISDIKFPEEIKARNLHHLGADHMTLNPFRHRAVFDVLTMFKVLECYDLNAVIARSQEPTLFVQAVVSFAENQKAKDFSFRWNPEQKKWWKGMKQSDFEAEKSLWQFTSRLLDGPLE
jgi:DNA polymerase-3 subunit epsilon